MNTFIARYPTTCAACGGYIAKGEQARYAAFDEIVHVTCPLDPTVLAARGACPECHQELPVSGVCGVCA